MTVSVMKKALWEYGSCPLCGNADSGFILYRFGPVAQYTSSIEWSSEFGSLGLRRCPCCGLFYLCPRPTEEFVRSIYASKDYFEKDAGLGYEDYAVQETSLRRTFKRFLVTLRRQGLVRGSMADIGCGPGYLLDEAKPFFRLRMGTDMCPEMAAQASALCDGVVCGGPRDLADVRRVFDLVTSISVLEHLYDPVDFLTGCAESLKDRGAVVLVTPNMNGFWRQCTGRRWPSFKLPEHIAFYDKRTLAVLADRAGMELVRVFPYHEEFPLGLILAKVGLGLPGKWSRRGPSVLLPNVMIAGVFKMKARSTGI